MSNNEAIHPIRQKQLDERGDVISSAINEAVGNAPGVLNPIGFFCIHFEFLNPDGSVGIATNANRDDITIILSAILARMKT